MKNELPAWYGQLMEKYPIVTLEEWKLLHAMASVKHIKKGEPLLPACGFCYLRYV
jgi:hypothetical protein